MMKLPKLSMSMLAAAVVVAVVAVVHQSASALSRTSSPAVSKRAMLDSIARTVLLPGYSDLAARSADFASAAEVLTSAPNLASLKGAQQAWKDVLLAWRSTQSFVHGPINDLGVYGRIQFWPSRRQTIDRVLRAQRPIDDQYIQELGASAVGLSALEVLLFDIRRDDGARLATFTGTEGERQRKYFMSLTKELVAKTRLVESAWKGQAGYAARFGSGGQQQLNLLVNDLLTAVETGAQGRLRIVIDRHAEPQFLSELVEGGPSGTSQQALLALLIGARTTFTGGDGIGLDDYLAQLKSPAARRVDVQFRKAIDAVRAIDSPLEQAIDVKAQAITRAHDECRALEILLKVEVASTLGVTLTFKSTDGD